MKAFVFPNFCKYEAVANTHFFFVKKKTQCRTKIPKIGGQNYHKKFAKRIKNVS